jgi:glutathione S-transferase
VDQRGQRHDRPDHDRDIVLPRLGILEKDEARIEAATGKLERQLNLIEDTLRKSTCLAGDRLALDDLFRAPNVFWLDKTPEG